jgi:hypothetical protein
MRRFLIAMGVVACTVGCGVEMSEEASSTETQVRETQVSSLHEDGNASSSLVLPTIPVVVNGVRHEPQALKRMDWKEVHLYVDPDSHAGKFVYAFPTTKARDTFTRQRQPGTVSPTVIDRYDPVFYEHAYRAGGNVQFEDCESQPYLGQVWCGWFGCQNWNDRFSSLTTGYSCNVVLYEHAHYGGSSILFARGGKVYDNLGLYGWDDIASALGFTY